MGRWEEGVLPQQGQDAGRAKPRCGTTRAPTENEVRNAAHTSSGVEAASLSS